MSDAADTLAADEVRCAECGTLVHAGADREVTAQGTFCRSCFQRLAAQVARSIEAEGRDIPWGRAVAGALAGAAVGILAWWGFTVVTKIAFGLVAIVIGYAVGRGVVQLTGGKRSLSLQALSVTVSVLAFFYASYLVNRTFLMRAMSVEGAGFDLPFAPPPQLFAQVVRLDFGVMDAVFLALVVWQAWKMPAPTRVAA
jgi:hypothetical protein